MSNPMENTVHIVGKKNHGKTTLIVELVRELINRGYKVGTIKHSGHQHELDTPGKDSHRQRRAGASPAAVVTGDLAAVFMPLTDSADIYRELASLYDECDIILVEGDRSGDGLMIEVWRREVGTAPLATEYDGIMAVVTDDLLEFDTQTWPRNNVQWVADQVLELLKVEKKA